MADPSAAHEPGGVLRSVEAGDIDEERFLAVLAETIEVLEGAELPHVIVGGLAVAALGRPRWTHDIDVLVRPDDARRALEILEAAGFQPEERDPLWLFKATKDEVTVDIIFSSTGHIYLDDEIIQRSQRLDFRGQQLQVVPPEDLLVIKAAAMQEDSAYHWFDALSLLTRTDLDWAYLARRARQAVRKVLSFLIFAESADLPVPRGLLRQLIAEVYGAVLPTTDPVEATQPEAQPDHHDIEQRLRSDTRLRGLDVEMTIEGDAVVITGEVASSERRQALESAVRELAGDLRVDNRTTVPDVSGAVVVEDIG